MGCSGSKDVDDVVAVKQEMRASSRSGSDQDADDGFTSLPAPDVLPNDPYRAPDNVVATSSSELAERAAPNAQRSSIDALIAFDAPRASPHHPTRQSLPSASHLMLSDILYGSGGTTQAWALGGDNDDDDDGGEMPLPQAAVPAAASLAQFSREDHVLRRTSTNRGMADSRGTTYPVSAGNSASVSQPHHTMGPLEDTPNPLSATPMPSECPASGTQPGSVASLGPQSRPGSLASLAPQSRRASRRPATRVVTTSSSQSNTFFVNLAQEWNESSRTASSSGAAGAPVPQCPVLGSPTESHRGSSPTPNARRTSDFEGEAAEPPTQIIDLDALIGNVGILDSAGARASA